MTTDKDTDLALGLWLIVFAGIASMVNIATLILVSHEPMIIGFAIVTIVWFLFAPVYLSKAIDMEQWTFSMYGNSIWSTLRWRYYREHNLVKDDGVG
jgi:hypothetical protein